ncbi:hypothetical protein F5148DRAFT_95108 [Russula earlei]|uniref:Uncharacterized protein n=1 Tax=Russula earlei TaxID=71964 RepID=A0ACC0U7C7_9AGAM|nr:hypothetical protein F5148DRAFT_95108 [Russula earlei]
MRPYGRAYYCKSTCVSLTMMAYFAPQGFPSREGESLMSRAFLTLFIGGILYYSVHS